MEIQSLRLLIRETLSLLIQESEQPEYVIHWDDYHQFYFLYKRVFGKDEQGDEIEQLQYVRGLGNDRQTAQKRAFEITGQHIPAIKPRINAKALKINYRADTVMPVGPYKGRKYKDIPLDYLVNFIMNRKWIEMIRAEAYVSTMYDYLTIDVLPETQIYLQKFIQGESTPALIQRHKNYKNTRMPKHYEAIAFRKIILPIIEDTLRGRGIQYDTSTGEYRTIPSEQN